MTTKSIEGKRWLILGAGAVLTEYYLPAFEYLNAVENLTVVDLNPARVNTLQADYSLNAICDSFDHFISNSLPGEFDFAIIMLPNKFHLQAISLLHEKGIPMLCEKPLVTKSDDLQKLEILARKEEGMISVAMVRRLTPAFQTLRKVLSEIGNEEILEVSIADGNPFAWVADSAAFFDPQNGGVLADMGVHYLDQLEQLFSSIELVKYSDDWNGGVEANATLGLLLEERIPCKLRLSRTYTLENVFEIKCKDCVIQMEKDDFSQVKILSKGLVRYVQMESAFLDHNLAYDYLSCFVEQIQQFSNAVVCKKEFNAVNTVVASTKIIDQCYGQRIPKPVISANAKKYFITGASGFVGSSVINRLATMDVHVTAGVRSFKTCSEIARNNIALKKIDISDRAQLEAAFIDQDYVVHLAYDSDGQESNAINFEASKKVVNAAIESKVKSIVILSTMYVYGQNQHDCYIDEQSPLNPFGGKYAESKAKMQKWVLERAKTSGSTRIVVLNPSCVYGPLGKTYTTLPSILEKTNRFFWVTDGSGIANYVYIENLVEAILLSLEKQEAHAQNFIISDGFCTWKEFIGPMLNKASDCTSLDRKGSVDNNSKSSTLKEVVTFLVSNYELMELVNRHPWLGALKRFIFKAVPSFKGQLNKQRFALQKNTIAVRSNATSTYPEWIFDLYGLNASKFKSDKAHEVLGWKPTISLAKGLECTRAWLKENNFLTK